MNFNPRRNNDSSEEKRKIKREAQKLHRKSRQSLPARGITAGTLRTDFHAKLLEKIEKQKEEKLLRKKALRLFAKSKNARGKLAALASKNEEMPVFVGCVRRYKYYCISAIDSKAARKQIKSIESERVNIKTVDDFCKWELQEFSDDNIKNAIIKQCSSRPNTVFAGEYRNKNKKLISMEKLQEENQNNPKVFGRHDYFAGQYVTVAKTKSEAFEKIRNVNADLDNKRVIKMIAANSKIDSEENIVRKKAISNPEAVYSYKKGKFKRYLPKTT